MKKLENKKILLIICGGIAAYKSLELIRLFKKMGASVKTVVTKNAKKFVVNRQRTKLFGENWVRSCTNKVKHVLVIEFDRIYH